MSAIKPSLRQVIWDFCARNRRRKEISEHVSAHTSKSAAGHAIDAMVGDHLLRRVSMGVYIRTDLAPKGRGRSRRVVVGQGIQIGKAKQSVEPWQEWPESPPHTVTVHDGVRITVAHAPPGRYEARGPVPRMFELGAGDAST